MKDKIRILLTIGIWLTGLAILGLVLLITGLLLSCNGPPTVPPPVTTTTTTIKEPPTGRYPKVTVSDRLYVDGAPLRLFSAFALPRRSRAYARELCYEGRAHGFNAARVFAEADRWRELARPGQRSWWIAEVAFDYDKRALKEVIKGLGEAGCAVELVPVATYKNRPLQAQKDHVRRVVRAFAKYRHVIFDVVNEYETEYPGLEKWRAAQAMITVAQFAGARIVSIDEGVPPQGHKACGRQSEYCNYIALHPGRNDPRLESLEFFSRVVSSFTKPVLFNENTCYVSIQNLIDYPKMHGWSVLTRPQKLGAGDNRLKFDRQRRRLATKIIVNQEAAGANVNFHSIDLIRVTLDPPEIWFPSFN